jgi:hypothetical protein
MNQRLVTLEKWIFSFSVLALMVSACSLTTSRTLVPTIGARLTQTSPVDKFAQPPTQSPVPSPSVDATIEPSPSPTPSLTSVPTQTPTAAPTFTPSETAAPSITPTYAILRGTILEQSNCRYGPGAAYLYKYGVYKDYYMDMIGRNSTGTWVVVQAIGGNNPCWVKASLINIKGDIVSLAPMSLPLPQSPYYGPLTGISAIRKGNMVILSWNPLILRAGDDSLQYPYLVEAWLCKNGQLSFSPIGTWDTILTVQDEAGCAEASHARVYGVEKHGYTAWVNFAWPKP